MPQSGSHGGAVGSADGLPIAGIGRQRVLGGQLLVDVDAEARGLVDVHVALVHRRTTGEDLTCPIAYGRRLLDAEIPGRQVQVCIGGVADRGDIARTVPGAADVETLSHGCYL